MKHLRFFFLLSMFTSLFSYAHTDKSNNVSLNSEADSVIINVLGDSYVRNHRRPFQEAWHYLVAIHNGCKYNNYGRNGGCVAFDRSREGFGPSLLVRYREMDPSADIVLVIAGHNDAVIVGDSKEKLAVFEDSLTMLIQKIREQCPKAKIGWVTPWWVDQKGFEPVVKSINHICRKNNVPVLNNFNKKCIIKVRDAEFRKKYFQGANDTAHLNAEGHILFFETGNKFVQKLLKKIKHVHLVK